MKDAYALVVLAAAYMLILIGLLAVGFSIADAFDRQATVLVDAPKGGLH